MPSEQRKILIPSLFGGISQQPAHMRHVNQVSDAINAAFSVVDGASKRQGSMVSHLISDITDGAYVRMHEIERDQNEKYVVVYGDGILKVYEMDGPEATVTVSAGAQTYLDLNSATADELRLVTIADYTLIVNTTVALAMNDSTDYTVSGEHETIADMMATTPAADSYHKVQAIDTDDPSYWQYDPGTGLTFATLTCEAVSGNWATPTYWQDSSRSPSGFTVGFVHTDISSVAALWDESEKDLISYDRRTALSLSGVTYTHGAADAAYLTKAGAFSAITWQSGDRIYVTGGTGVTAGFYEVDHDNASNDSDNVYLHEPLDAGADGSADLTTNGICNGTTWAGYTLVSGERIYVTGGTNITTGWYTISAKDSDSTLTLSDSIASDTSDHTDVTFSGIGYEYEVIASPAEAALSDMHDVAALYQQALRDAGAHDALVAWQPQGVGGAMVITSPYRGSTASITDTGTPSSGTDLTAASSPFVTDTKTAGTGTTSAKTLPVADRWNQVAAPGQGDAEPDTTTMPVKMVRTGYTGDGTTPATFDVSQIDWTPRPSGDPTTNPLPSLWQNASKIADISFHRNRLVFGGDENIVFSQDGDFFNFFLQDHENIVDSDPIDIALSSDQVTLIDYILPFRESLAIFTKAGRQFELNAPQTLTPTSAAVTPTTAFKTLPVRPVSVGHTMFMVARNVDNAQVLEYYYDDSFATTDADDISKHVPRLVPLDVKTIKCDVNHGIVYVLPKTGDVLYVYFFYWQEQKVQSAWSKWNFGDGVKIADIVLIEDDIIIINDDDDAGWDIETVKPPVDPGDNPGVGDVAAPPEYRVAYPVRYCEDGLQTGAYIYASDLAAVGHYFSITG